MPFGIQGGYVVNLDTGEKKNKKPMSHARLVAYQRALYANSPDVRHKERFIGDSAGRIVRRGMKKSTGLHSFVQPPEVQTKSITDTLLGKHPEPHGPLRLRSMQGRYLGLVGKRRKLVRRLKAYNEGQHPRDNHGRWARVGSALHALGKVRLRPYVQAVGATASSLVGTAHTVSKIGHSRPRFHLPKLNSLLDTIEGAEDAILVRRRARFKAGYNPSEPRDSHGRWTVGGGALGRLFAGHKNRIYAVANELYGMKRKPPDIEIKTHRFIVVNGEVINGYYSPTHHIVGVATQGEHPALTTAHEIGHAIDHRGMKQPWNSRSPEARRWRAAVENTPEIRQWRKWQKQGYIEVNGNRYKVDPAVFRYFLSNRELWARSFAQWHAGRSRQRSIKSELRIEQHNPLGLQWSNRNFGPVNDEITRLMRQNGYI